MNKHTTISVNYREFTNWTEDRMILARGNAAAIRRNADDYADPDVLATAYEARAEAMFEAWQFVTVSNYDEADRARLADLLHWGRLTKGKLKYVKPLELIQQDTHSRRDWSCFTPEAYKKPPI